VQASGSCRNFIAALPRINALSRGDAIALPRKSERVERHSTLHSDRHDGATFEAHRNVLGSVKRVSITSRAGVKTNHFKRVSNHFARIKVPLDMQNSDFVQVRCIFFCFF
jgi:hypothetical protein